MRSGRVRARMLKSPRARGHGQQETSLQRMLKWVKRPSSRWVRIPLASGLILGGLVGFLPILGFWMLPLGFFLLGIDFPLARRLHRRLRKWYGDMRERLATYHRRHRAQARQG